MARGKRQDDPELKPAFRSGISNNKGPTCHDCTWVVNGDKWRLKFVNRACRRHRRYA